MLTSIGKFSKSFFVKVLVGIIILPFVFWGMGNSFFGGSNWHVWLLQLMPKIVKKEYWYEDVKEIVPRFENYLARLDSSVKQSISQKSILEGWYGK